VCGFTREREISMRWAPLSATPQRRTSVSDASFSPLANASIQQRTNE
jgi:hypothetical protein